MSSNVTCRVDIGDDGAVVASLAAQDSVTNGYLWAAYSATGDRFMSSLVGGNDFPSVAIDAAHSQLYVAWFYNSNTGREPMVMPALDAYSYSATGGKPPTLAYRDFPWSAVTYRSPGPCDGDVADGRIMGLRSGRDAQRSLLVMGRSDGGDSPFQCGMRNASRATPLAQIDGYTSPYNMQAQAITNFLKVDAEKGETVVGQLQLVRLQSTQGNTLVTLAAQSDEGGNVYLLQAAACCLPNMANLTVNGQALVGPTDSTALHVLNPSMTQRLHWTHFIAPNGFSSGEPVDIDVRGAAVAVVMTTGSPMALAGALPGTNASATRAPVGYLVVLPTIAAAAAAQW